LWAGDSEVCVRYDVAGALEHGLKLAARRGDR
jgi:hypothetical protein